MTLKELCSEGGHRLASAGLPEAAHDARALLFFLADMDLRGYLLRASEQAEPDLADRYFRALERRAGGEPLQYITGRAPFYGLELAVGPGVLIPRFDTETLVAALLPLTKRGMRILDLCTGSGCILIALLMEGAEGMRGTGVDLSATACGCARANVRQCGLDADAEILQCDLFSGVGGRFGMISANPPYIRSSGIAELDAEVREYEPAMALDGGEDGLAFYRTIIEEAPAYLEEGGVLGFEIGFDEGDDVMSLMRARGFQEIRLYRDIPGLPRAVTGIWRETWKKN